MKQFLIFSICATFSFILLTEVSFAQSALRPFGGRITSYFSGAVCTNSEGAPLIIQPAGRAITGPLPATTAVTRRYSYGTLRPGSWILGWYNPTPDSNTCYIPGEPPVNFPITPIQSFGSSR